MKIVMAVLLVLLSLPQEKEDAAPDFTLRNQEGREVKLSEFKGKRNVLLAFYPKDFTGGCTKEMKQFRDEIKTFEERNVELLGISADPVESHKKWCDELKLTFNLLADPEMAAHKAFKFENKVRALFLIDKAGKVLFVNRKYTLKPEEYQDLLKAVQALEK